jgi:hypothetical protein
VLCDSNKLEGRQNSCHFSGCGRSKDDNAGEPSHWPPLSELQRYFGIDARSHVNSATLQSKCRCYVLHHCLHVMTSEGDGA